VKRQTAVIFYVLAFYVALQFAWWGYHLIELTQEVAGTDNIVTHKVIMITGEGLVSCFPLCNTLKIFINNLT
jgi:hypothetical protein